MHHGVRRFRCSPGVSSQDVGSGWISEPQRGPTVAVLIIPPAGNAAIPVLSRRPTPGCRFRRYFRAPERASSSCLNHPPAWISRISVLPRRLLPGCRLRLDFRGPERANSSRWNHSAAWVSAISLLPRRLLPGCRLWLDFRAPERANSSQTNHLSSMCCSIFNDVSFQDLGSGWISEPQRGATVRV